MQIFTRCFPAKISRGDKLVGSTPTLKTGRAMINKSLFLRIGVTAVVALAFTGCASTYYGAMEKVGIHKRDILVDRVQEAREAQHEGKQEFKSALETFSEVLGFKGGALEEKYEILNDKYDNSKDSAEKISKRIDSVESVAKALFEEWKAEIQQYSNDKMRRDSESKLKQTKSQYEKMIAAMRQAESKMQPVLTALNDQVLYLKHNLNAKAIASLQSEFTHIEGDIGKLIKEMEKSIAEADRFIQSLGDAE
ncbi:MAG: DUF2959 domain-containing protein [Pseudomonadota bacterium]